MSAKRGRCLDPDAPFGYLDPSTQKLTRKRYTWICSFCGREYIYRSEAQLCHIEEKRKKKEKEDVLEI
jgi:hypothetical protein